ncbi:MAG: tetratricopeptide repeat protein [Actinomycetota bacterium]
MNTSDDLRRQLDQAASTGAPFRTVLELRDQLAAALLAEDRPLEAITELELALRMRILDGNPDDPDLLDMQGVLGRALTEAHRYDEAVAVLTQAVRDRTRVFGRDAHLTLVARGNLLRALGRSGRVRAALVMADELIADRLRLLGHDHPSTFDARGHRAQLLDLDGRSEQAVVELESLLADRIRVLGEGNPVILSTRHNLATIRGRCQHLDDDQVRWELEQNYAAVAAAHGPDHPDTFTALGVLAEYLMSSGEPAEALPILDQIIAGRTAVLGSDAAPTLTSRRVRCMALAAVGELARAINEAGDLVGDARRALGPANYETLLANLKLVDLLTTLVDSDPLASEDVHSWLESEVVRITRADVSNLDRDNQVRQRIEALRGSAAW